MNDVHRLAIVGCGNVSNMHFRGYLSHPERVEIVAACDPEPERRHHVGATYGVHPQFPTLDELLRAVDFDVAVVCTPSHVRLDTVRALASAGKHVLVEKPMADDLNEAQEIVRTCAQEGVKLSVNQNFRDHYSFGLARDAIMADEIGEVIGIDHRELTFRTVQGWRAKARHNALAVMGVHWFDGFRYLLADDADWLAARTYSSPANPSAGETDAFVQIHFGRSTVNYTQSFSSRVGRVETIVFGEAGTLALTYDYLEIARADGTLETRHNPYASKGKPESAYRSLERLLDAVEGDNEPTNSGVDNLKTLSLAAGAYKSAETDQPVGFKKGLL